MTELLNINPKTVPVAEKTKKRKKRNRDWSSDVKALHSVMERQRREELNHSFLVSVHDGAESTFRVHLLSAISGSVLN